MTIPDKRAFGCPLILQSKDNMKAEQLLEKRAEIAKTCDVWGHVISKTMPRNEVSDNRPIITWECDLWGHPCPKWLWLHERVAGGEKAF
jgi:hypothetical protein